MNWISPLSTNALSTDHPFAKDIDSHEKYLLPRLISLDSRNTDGMLVVDESIVVDSASSSEDGSMVRTFSGIVRGLGKADTIRFLRGYVNERVHEGMTLSAIESLLASYPSRERDCSNQIDSAISIYNCMIQYGQSPARA